MLLLSWCNYVALQLQLQQLRPARACNTIILSIILFCFSFDGCFFGNYMVGGTETIAAAQTGCSNEESPVRLIEFRTPTRIPLIITLFCLNPIPTHKFDSYQHPICFVSPAGWRRTKGWHGTTVHIVASNTFGSDIAGATGATVTIARHRTTNHYTEKIQLGGDRTFQYVHQGKRIRQQQFNCRKLFI